MSVRVGRQFIFSQLLVQVARRRVRCRTDGLEAKAYSLFVPSDNGRTVSRCRLAKYPASSINRDGWSTVP